MNPLVRIATLGAIAAALALAGGCSSMESSMEWQATGQQVRLDGSKEVPPVATSAYGTGTVNIATDRSVTVTVSVVDMTPTAAALPAPVKKLLARLARAAPSRGASARARSGAGSRAARRGR